MTRTVAKSGFVRIWDGPIRLFHWSLVLLLLFSWWTASTHEMEWHLISGYCILSLLIFRLYWGVFGSRNARFTHFVRGPRATISYLRSRYHAPTEGHNPLGAWSIVAMLAILFAMVGTGLYSVDIDGLVSGPLSDYVEFDTGRDAAKMHGQIFTVIQAVVVIHLLAILIYLARRKNLITPMITGWGRAAEGVTSEPARTSLWVAAVGIALAAFAAYAVAHNFWQ